MKLRKGHTVKIRSYKSLANEYGTRSEGVINNEFTKNMISTCGCEGIVTHIVSNFCVGVKVKNRGVYHYCRSSIEENE